MVNRRAAIRNVAVRIAIIVPSNRRSCLEELVLVRVLAVVEIFVGVIVGVALGVALTERLLEEECVVTEELYMVDMTLLEEFWEVSFMGEG